MNEWEWQLLEEKTPLDHFEISGVKVRAGGRVRLRPRKGGDVMDIALTGQTATIECIEQDYEGKCHVCVVLDNEISTDDQCLTYTEPAEDAKENSHHYKNLLLQWQLMFLQWELEWDPTTPYAAIELGAISEAHKMFFGQTGITAFLDNIGFEYTEDDQQVMQETLAEFRGERS